MPVVAQLPSKFDVIVVGTGLTESIVAAAAARAGRKVLHLDTNAFYGARNATFNLHDLTHWLSDDDGEDNPVPEVEAELPADAFGLSEASSSLPPPPDSLTLAVERVREQPTKVSYYGGGSGALPSAALAKARRYNVDLTPQLLLSAGAMVDCLRSSGVGNYIEFKPVTSYLYGEREEEASAEAAGTSSGKAKADSALRRVPCGKADIFQSSSIPFLQKRQLMKFLQSCAALQPQLEPEARSTTAGPSGNVRAAPDAVPTPVAAAEGTLSLIHI